MVTDLLFSRYAACLKNSTFSTPIQPLSSHLLKCCVRPSITYLKSDIMVSGQKFGKELIASITAMISPTWLDCLIPGTLMAAFLPWFDLIQMLLPHLAFAFPLFQHAPSM